MTDDSATNGKGIEQRTRGVDLNANKIDSSYRAALHQHLSETAVPLEVIRSQLKDSLFVPLTAEVNQVVHRLQNFIWDNFTGRDIVQLSPVGIFGIDQHITQSSPLKIAHVASRPADVVADPTVQLAVEAVRRRVAGERQDLSLGAFHRCLRLQKYRDPSRMPTFEMFGTVDTFLTTNEGVKQQKMLRLIGHYLDLFAHFAPKEQFEVCVSHIGIGDHALAQQGIVEAEFEQKSMQISEYFHPDIRGRLPIHLTETTEYDVYAEKLGIAPQAKVIQELVKKLPPRDNANYTFRLDRAQGIGHYSGLAFMILHQGMDLVDGGEVNWISKLTSNKKETSFVTGYGTELFAKLLKSLQS